MIHADRLKFGRRYAPDPRDAKHPMRDVIPKEVALASRFYRRGPTLDQGETPMCVGYAWDQFLRSEPLMTATGPYGPQIYHEAQLADEWPGEDYEGTSVRGGAKALLADTRLNRYVWAANALDVRDFLITTGTVVMGTDWRNGMFDPDPATGLLKLSGPVAGGHAYLLCGYDAPRDWFQMVNSWDGWGLDGTGVAFIAFGDLDRLIRAHGEACAAVER
jgi:hypothetical protein